MNAYDRAVPATATENGGDLLLELFLEEIRFNASEEEEVAFLRAIGVRLARRFPLSGQGEADALEQDCNAVFFALGLGTTQIRVTEDALTIRHCLDRRRADMETSLATVWPALLEGAYDTWLRTLGSGPRLHTSIVSIADNAIEFRHGV